MARRRTPPTGWDWICAWGSSQGLDFTTVPPSDATERLLSRLEHCRDNGLPFPPEMVRLASLLVRIQGQLAIQGLDATWENAQPWIEQAFGRDRARRLSWMRENLGLLRPKREILEPEPEREEKTATLYDLVRNFQDVLEMVQKASRKRTPDPSA
jgi:hypothetical protein